ncbi:MAG: flagellar basal body L-ring protein FlgH [Gemmatales bacterium]|nr:flagellar basal body L-ring protein FlgH [Gemmatales bacterium]MDW8175997.1 flagellar basal body L-ring protein FlgH [Gemmatales bacterium]
MCEARSAAITRPSFGVVLIISEILFGGLSRNLWGESLWDRRHPNSAFLFVDQRARRVGDVLTVIINESTDIEHRDNRNMEKQTRSAEVFQFRGKTQGNVSTRQAAADLNIANDAQREFQGRADYRADRRMADRMTVEVIAVLPNGNLVVEGYRSRFVSGEQRVLRLRGIVRPIDIASNNTIQSQFIANLAIEYLGRGYESSYNDPNWWGRIMNVLWPF